ncbi:hypothetical protein PPL_05068 [Heterostelium album PN500]|uniref:Saposin B-type domain-containing protein n=1 Tax=Heterostelium pallidum (strain ATCC 26659 / Pp 5 / PN500) TaxID=670386 RepID=D3B9C4_HETP5|nr:hypothetical protein PPL_05068 [Heterostelium album PN500]EFA81836.1 hypothetical protein PPL_05068 [Heterostelium album PN500]|eukprot:XP_020433953.1 hypothetical protein PPL_05068 [Heterostelium album PN500]
MKFLIAFVVILAVFASSAQANNVLKCDLCQYVVKHAESLILRNHTQNQIIHQMEKACHHLPHKWSGHCVSLIDVHGSDIITRLINHEKPAVVCKQLHICKNHVGEVMDIQDEFDDEDFDDEDFDDEDFDLFEFEQELLEALDLSDNLEKKHHIPGHNIVKKYKCKACHFLVKKAEHLVKLNKRIDEIQSALEHECKPLCFWLELLDLGFHDLDLTIDLGYYLTLQIYLIII